MHILVVNSLINKSVVKAMNISWKKKLNIYIGTQNNMTPLFYLIKIHRLHIGILTPFVYKL